MRYYDSVITSLNNSRDMLIDAKGSDYSGVTAMTAAIEHLEKEHIKTLKYVSYMLGRELIDNDVL